MNVRTNRNGAACGALAAIVLLAGCAHSPPSPETTSEATQQATPPPAQDTRKAKRARRAKDGNEAVAAEAGATVVAEAVAQRHAAALAAIESERYDEAEA